MKYYIYAKILGTLMPTKSIRLGDCKIVKDFYFTCLNDDNINKLISLDKQSEFHSRDHGVKNYVFFPQKKINSRIFESEYIIFTEVELENIYDAVDEAEKRFNNTTAALSLSMKQTVVSVNNRRFRRSHSYYDFEICAVFIKRKNKFIRIRFPDPLTNGHNYFPQPFPQNFINRTKKYLECGDIIFRKGMVYLEKAHRMYNSDNFSHVEIILNLVKCVELISKSVGVGKIYNEKKKKYEEPSTKKLFEMAGKKLNVTKKYIKYVQEAWDARNKADIAHQNEDFNSFAMINYEMLDMAVGDYLIKYYNSGIRKYPYFRMT